MQNIHGCDSINLNLTIHKSNSVDLHFAVCDSLNFMGKTLNKNGSYQFTLQNAGAAILLSIWIFEYFRITFKTKSPAVTASIGMSIIPITINPESIHRNTSTARVVIRSIPWHWISTRVFSCRNMQKCAREYYWPWIRPFTRNPANTRFH